MSVIDSFSDFLSAVQRKHGVRMIWVLALIAFLVLPGIFFLPGNVEPSLEKVLPADVDEVSWMNDMRSLFGADMVYVVLYSEGVLFDVREPEAFSFISVFSDKLKENPFILGANSYPSLIDSGADVNTVRGISRALDGNDLARSYISPGYEFTILEIRSDTGADFESIDLVVNQIQRDFESLESLNPGFSYKVTGFNALDRATFGVIMSDFALIMAISFLFMLIFLFVYFKSVKKVLISMSVIVFSLIVTLGITGYIGLEITVVTMVAGAMIMALGISYGINVLYEYYNLRENLGKDKALHSLNRSLTRALLGSSLTTSAGFLALLFGVMPAMKNLGIVLSIGIIVALVYSVVFLPVILYKLDSKG